MFTIFCFELAQEQFESIGDNQTYIDDMKDLAGKPLDLIDGFKQTLGVDWKWWLAPTRPVIKINFLEEMFTFKEIKTFDDDYEEEESDPN
jgi:hypothetical protein